MTKESHKDGTSEFQPGMKFEKGETDGLRQKKDFSHVALFETQTKHFTPQLEKFRDHVFDRLITQIDFTTVTRMDRSTLRAEIERFIHEYSEESQTRVTFHEQQQVADDIINDMIGLGPLEVLLKDPDINDILVNAFDTIFVERKGKLYLTNVRFRNRRHLMQVAQRIANFIGRRVDESSPMVDARLKDGSRVNVIVPPIALEDVSISIRKFSQATISLEEMVGFGSLSRAMCAFLKIAAKCRLNIIVAGGTGAGKTTLLNALSQLIEPNERIVTLEDSAELKLDQPHVIRLESRPPNIEGSGEVTIRDLVKNALRMRPDRIIVGECRGAEAFDMLQAMNTGHDGSMSTIHANSAREAINRLENMLLMAGNSLPIHVIRNYIVDAVDLIVHVARMRDGRRRITQICEVKEIVNGIIDFQDIFKFEYTSTDASGIIQGTYKVLETNPGILEKARWFGEENALLSSLQMQQAGTGDLA